MKTDFILVICTCRYSLIALGGREASEERLSNALWPDADGDLAHESFTITLHRLRRLMAGTISFACMKAA